MHVNLQGNYTGEHAEMRALMRLPFILPFMLQDGDYARFIHTRLSWKAPPAAGAGWSAPVSVLMPQPSSISRRWARSFRNQHAAPLPSAALACSVTTPRCVAELHLGAIGDAQRGQIIRMDEHRRPTLALHAMTAFH